MIELKGIGKVFPARRSSEAVRALENVNLKIGAGEIFGVIGRSGAGKSTLLRLVNGLESPTEGSVQVDGREISRLSEAELRAERQKIGMIFQHFNLLWSRTVWQNVAFPLEVAGKSKADIRKKVDYLLERVGLSERADAYPAQLSGGQKQRVGIARALANDPKVLLCDEATSALDPETTSSILQLLKEINEEMGITLLLITHEMDVVQEICHRMAVMEEGQVIETGEVEQLFHHPTHPLTRQFVHQVERAPAESPSGVRITCSSQSFPQVWGILQTAKNNGVTVNMLGGEVSEEDQITFVLDGAQEEMDRVLHSLEEYRLQGEVKSRV
ncbi:MAG: ATP-binding cassette domain-containing protein [Firmicutes bacterium]|uniref:D-methionine transport system ATP-binding protein n=1 Tax=Melghirimyces thermohalophilus TaxID=1236220 RepID=A0A1G6ME13_9BACL|nr:ATP-binding cassette domain-containing protein [Melghirimyces thermohalophilus]MDA8353270.1 ATP-binding cassette domain-containing protein [Bacillota bacterium]SDC53848.1 D-methionine transport system ATP-binding protein [Melghirimyces thermohalophilus]